MKKIFLASLFMIFWAFSVFAQEMDKLWGDSSAVKNRSVNSQRGKLFDQGNYAMFIHWGLYSGLAGKVDGKTYYGISEWIMSPSLANIPVEKYKSYAADFNPVKFDAMQIAQIAKDAGMKYIVITSKHTEGFAMYPSKADPFNIYDATAFNRDPLRELSDACKKVGIGIGFYYSHYQDWTAPGGFRGPKTDAKGNPATFDDYFKNKCLPQVNEITSNYGPLELIWFDTPGSMQKKYLQQLVDLVRKNQPNALINGRIGKGMGDYQTLGDMAIPVKNIEGLWESVNTTNDSWAFAWYDENWKTPKQILSNVVTCVGRGGTYMLNIGLKDDGSIPPQAAESLRAAGQWISRYPQVIYDANSSPWQHALPWGDVTSKDNSLFLVVFNWPTSGNLFLSGLKSEIKSAKLLGSKSQKIKFEKIDSWVKFQLPVAAPEKLASVIQLDLDCKPKADPTLAIDPQIETTLLADFASTEGANVSDQSWMEKFGEWKHIKRINKWTQNGKAFWEIDVLKPGNYSIELTYTGKDRLVWAVDIQDGQHIQNQQNSSNVYQRYPLGWINFPKPGKYKISISCIEGQIDSASLKAIHLTPIDI